MFSSLLSRDRRGRPRRPAARDDSLSPPSRRQPRQYTGRTHATADFTADDDDDEEEDDDFNAEDFSRLDNGDQQDDNDDAVDEDEDGQDQPSSGLPVLPLFSSSHLGMCMALPNTPLPCSKPDSN